MPSNKKVVITGVAGIIGRVLRQSLKEHWELSGVDIVSVPDVPTLLADITDQEALATAFKEAYAVIHLAGKSNVSAQWNDVFSPNIMGTKSVFEAARKVGVQKIIFASSNHITGLYENDEPYTSIVEGRYEDLKESKIPMITHEFPIRPDGPYGISKVFGEILGHFYSETFGIQVLCLRIGTVNHQNFPLETRYYSTLLTHRDLHSLIETCLYAENVSYGVFYGVSDNTWRFWDIDHAKNVLGWTPQDNAEVFRNTPKAGLRYSFNLKYKSQCL